MLPLPISVLSISESEEEDDGYPCIFFLNDNHSEVKQKCDEEEEDVAVIDSREVNQMGACDDQAFSTSRGEASSEDKMKNVNCSSDEKGKEDWEMYADNSSFWEDGQRLTDSWYWYEKVPDDGLDDIFIEGASNVENNNYIHEPQIAPIDGNEISDDGDDNLLLQELMNMEAEESILQRLRTVSVNSGNIQECRNNDDDNVGAGGFSIDDDSFDKVISEYACCFLFYLCCKYQLFLYVLCKYNHYYYYHYYIVLFFNYVLSCIFGRNERH